MDELVFVGTVDVLSQRIVIRITNSAGRRNNSILSKAFVIGNADVLRSMVCMVNQARCFLRTYNRLVKRLQRQDFRALQPLLQPPLQLATYPRPWWLFLSWLDLIWILLALQHVYT